MKAVHLRVAAGACRELAAVHRREGLCAPLWLTLPEVIEMIVRVEVLMATDHETPGRTRTEAPATRER